MTPNPPAEALLPTVGSHWLHRKSGGTYYVLAVAKIEADLTPAVVYQSTYDDKVWVRPLANFMDGRFEQTPDPRAALTPKPVEHVLYKTGDADAPDCIKDRNGEVVLGLCRVCNKGEVELADACVPPKPEVAPDDEAVLDDLISAIENQSGGSYAAGERSDIARMRAAVLKRMAGKVPEGWRLVPINPTHVMMETAFAVYRGKKNWDDVLRSAILAAPEASR